jgi:hypothetical protein
MSWRPGSEMISHGAPRATRSIPSKRGGRVPGRQSCNRQPATCLHGTGDTSRLRGSTVEHCVVTRDFAERVGLGPKWAIRWSSCSRGGTDEVDRIILSVRRSRFRRASFSSQIVVHFHRAGGVEAAVAMAQQRRGTQFDPGLVDLFCAKANDLLAAIGETNSWNLVLVAEPGLQVRLKVDEMERVLEGIADFTDLKSPYMLGHARGWGARRRGRAHPRTAPSEGCSAQ